MRVLVATTSRRPRPGHGAHPPRSPRMLASAEPAAGTVVVKLLTSFHTA